MGPLGVCSWSLQPPDAAGLAARVRDCGVDAVQLALDPLRTGAMPVDDVVRELDAARIAVLSGMMAMAGEDYATLESIRRTGGLVPDATFPANLRAAADNADVARGLGIRLVTFHVGFIPDSASSPGRNALVERLRRVRDTFGEHGIDIALETGQETASGLHSFLDEVGGDVGVNFDPANMILYGTGDPVAALRELASRVRQVHVKDARPSDGPGQWGIETPVGQGAVDWDAFLNAVPGGVALVIERESGDDRIADVRRAAERVRAHRRAP